MNPTLKLITLLFIALTFITSCQSNKEALLGWWRLESASTNNEKLELCESGEEPYHIQFMDNGVLRQSYSDIKGSFEILDDSLLISIQDIQTSWHFLVDEDLLTMTCKTTDGKTMVQTYSRQLDYKFE
jgi:hypothetical protein